MFAVCRPVEERVAPLPCTHGVTDAQRVPEIEAPVRLGPNRSRTLGPRGWRMTLFIPENAGAALPTPAPAPTPRGGGATSEPKQPGSSGFDTRPPQGSVGHRMPAREDGGPMIAQKRRSQVYHDVRLDRMLCTRIRTFTCDRRLPSMFSASGRRAARQNICA